MKLNEKCLLVNLHITAWSGRKLDKQITNETNRQHGAAADAGRYNKQLIAPEALKAIGRAAGDARTYHYAHTLPWADDGARILPAAQYLDYTAEMRRLKSAWENAVRGFVADWPAHQQAAMLRLNGMYNPADYPTPDQVERAYTWNIECSPLPTGEDFRAALSEDECAAIRADIERRTTDRLAAAQRELWDRLFAAVRHMAEKLQDPKSIFRDSLVVNLRDLCTLLPRLNVTDNPDLERQRLDVERLLTTTPPETLRTDNTARAATAAAASQIAATMAAYMGSAA